MRVLLLAQLYPPVIGGEERHVRNLAVALAARGHEVHVATYDTGEPAQQDPGVAVHLLDHVGRRLPGLYPTADRPLALPVPDPLTTRDLARLVRDLAPDVVHAHNWIVSSYVALPAARRLPLVLSLHDYSHACATKRLMFLDGEPCSGPSLRKCVPCAGQHYGRARGPVIAGAVAAGSPRRRGVVDLFTPVSRFVGEANRLDQQGVRWEVVPNFVPDELVSMPEPPRDPALPGTPYLFFAGDLSEQKGVHTLMEAWRRLPDGRPDLVLVGRPADRLGPLPEGVHVHHHWDHPRVLSGFRHATAAVLPSEWPDPCPTTVLEAMATGAPLITTGRGGIADMVVPGESALVVPPGDPAALSAAIGALVADPARAAALAGRGRQEVGRFLQSSVAARFEELYADVRASARRGGSPAAPS
ncbi:glycosyltransferase family 4 protein [Nocardioides dongkuii]|uniref:glycosyltransferase family 4 protein n=1 Tax=Nocardioides dongkuii TaxID=2760089 RepID=UPI0015F9B53B|nr:glycosyltransferase family 4 protein [Nocardioides dongkuii]